MASVVRKASRSARERARSKAGSGGVAPTGRAKTRAAVEFTKRTLTITSDVARSLKIAAVVEHEVSESALVEVAVRRFLALPKAEQSRALAGIGRRRTKA